MKTVLITGCSSGYGLHIARHFHNMGWNVVATMRTPCADILPRSERMHIIALDVTNPDSVATVIKTAGPIDVLVNNAGIGAVGALEATKLSTIRELFETNTFGVIAMMQAVIPQFRERRAGTIVNVTSSTTLASFPLAAAYTASKTAIDGLTGSVAHELAAFDIRIKLVEPGYGPSTRFAENGGARMQGTIPAAYLPFAEPIFSAFANPSAVTTPQDVADAVWEAAHDTSARLHFAAGADAVALASAKSRLAT
ncbi:MAG: SDR family oxidoreductase [Pseudomonadota bacterium]